MIDGVKIRCIGTSLSDWVSNSLLTFASKLDESTGEILSGHRIAWFKGLTFKIVPSTISGQGEHLFVSGSLAKYYNGGKNNAFDFDVLMLKQVIEDLQREFAINQHTAIIQKLEFGANVQPPKAAKKIIEDLRAWQSETFSGLKMENVFVGKQIVKQRNSFKIYDKALQQGNEAENLLRMEYVFEYNAEAQKHGINVLADLLDTDKLEAIKPLLCDMWANAIFFESSTKRQTLQNMTDWERKKLLLYLDGTAWANWDRTQRKRAKKHFEKLCNEYSTSTLQTDVLNLLIKKLNDLTKTNTNMSREMRVVHAQKSVHGLQNFFQPNKSQNKKTKCTRFTTLDKGCKRVQIEIEKTSKIGSKNLRESLTKKGLKIAPKLEQKFCVVCGENITLKKPKAMYCSKHCNNSARAKREKQERQNTAVLETILLDDLQLETTNLHLLVTYRHLKSEYTDALFQNEIEATPEQARQVTRVIFFPDEDKEIRFTSFRAKKLISVITNLNKQKVK